jgi:hypothetical protein
MITWEDIEGLGEATVGKISVVHSSVYVFKDTFLL